jgi:hypothetical protein
VPITRGSRSTFIDLRSLHQASTTTRERLRSLFLVPHDLPQTPGRFGLTLQ